MAVVFEIGEASGLEIFDSVEIVLVWHLFFDVHQLRQPVNQRIRLLRLRHRLDLIILALPRPLLLQNLIKRDLYLPLILVLVPEIALLRPVHPNTRPRIRPPTLPLKSLRSRPKHRRKLDILTRSHFLFGPKVVGPRTRHFRVESSNIRKSRRTGHEPATSLDHGISINLVVARSHLVVVVFIRKANLTNIEALEFLRFV